MRRSGSLHQHRVVDVVQHRAAPGRSARAPGRSSRPPTLVPELDRAGARLLDLGQAAQQRGLPGAVASDDDDTLAALDGEVDVGEDLRGRRRRPQSPRTTIGTAPARTGSGRRKATFRSRLMTSVRLPCILATLRSRIFALRACASVLWRHLSAWDRIFWIWASSMADAFSRWEVSASSWARKVE